MGFPSAASVRVKTTGQFENVHAKSCMPVHYDNSLHELKDNIIVAEYKPT